MKIKGPLLYSFLVVLFHAVGLFGFLTPSLNQLFLQLVPFHLMLMLALLIASERNKNKHYWFFLGVIYLAGFFIEWAGVHSGLIFGYYSYLTTLGPKLWQIPLLIGVNWVILIYSVGCSLTLLKFNKWLLAVSGAVLLVALDYLIEPVAIRFDYWHWEYDYIPRQNYIAWFGVSLLMLFVFQSLQFHKRNTVALVMLFTQFIFFLALNLSLR